MSNVGFMISEEDLASESGTRPDHSGLSYGRSFITVKKDRETSYIDIRREMESLKLFEKQPQMRKFF